MQLNLVGFAERSRIYGPGLRFVVWVQGCSIRCPGCWNRETWEIAERELWDADALAARIVADRELEGITLLGGEPMDQAAALVSLADQVHTAGLTVMTFTGYEADELRQPPRSDLVDRSELLVIGRYRAEERDTNLLWRGSRNQQIIARGARYADLELVEANQCEIVISHDGKLELRGFPPGWLRQM